MSKKVLKKYKKKNLRFFQKITFFYAFFEIRYVLFTEFDSSALLTLGDINETYAKITELETLKTTIEELTSRIAALETTE